MKQIYLIFLLSIIGSSLFSQNTMIVQDPQSWWNDDDASVDNIEYTVEIHGIYAQIDIAFDVMASNNFLSGSEIPLEFVMNFTMDNDVVFNDSWLWIGTYISKGEIYERYEGTQIYEEIVDRRQDPSILTKHSGNHYSLKVYPLDPDSTRRVRLSYLQPVDFSNMEAEITIPYIILRSTRMTPQNVSITIKDNFDWSHYEPSLSNYQETSSFLDRTSYAIKNFKSIEDHKIQFMPTNASKPYYLGHYTDGVDKYYQLAYFPELEIEAEPTYNMIAIDLDDRHTYSSLTLIDLLDDLKDNLKTKLNERDFFNICYHDFFHKFVDNQWIRATDNNIDLAVQSILDNGADIRSNLDVLIPQSLAFINAKGIDANLLIISASTEYTYAVDADPFLASIEAYLNEIDVKVNISSLDIATRNTSSAYANGHYYRGNTYFYEVLKEKYGGTQFSLMAGSYIWNYLEKMLNSNVIKFSAYDFDVDTENGFAYSNFINTFNSTQLNAEDPIVSVGKYIGEFPFTVEFQGIIGGNAFNQKVTVEEADAIPLNHLGRSVWYGNYLLNNENTNDNDRKKEVIDISIAERLLCKKTIFLCLEPDTSAISSSSVIEEDDFLINTEDIQLSDNEIASYPNPFVESLTIEIPSSYDIGNQKLLLEVFDASGTLIAQSALSMKLVGEAYVLEWEATENMVSGMYIFRFRNDKIAFNKKVMFIRT